ncbi:aminopeptidase [Pseudobutyrivibrio xylanivorans]|uniref:M18 family aminopeptidase n=1 Tax=Pseudobutyrivibrio xylanivorans TaxID=185007 RepID=A0A5P6VQU3_PSEXY|nr:aminopeptidase [Pseudobutyrivibrio xylanivorans]QFJ54728.1 aminopeptidase [Pseudobutyrivibrio xylanivorans]
MERINAWSKYTSEKDMEKVMAFGEDYRQFLSDCKTERECVDFFIEKAEAAGYVNLETLIVEGKKLKAGDKVYAANKGKMLAVFNIGTEALENGLNILGAHIDSPRMDLKQNPLYEDTDIALLDTHYYGGIKKYQWVTIPLALHGVIAKKDGTTVKINVGEDTSDPVFGISDLLIHLAADQMDKKGAKVVEGEDLNIIVGGIPEFDKKGKKEKDAVKNNILKLLKEKYDIEEEDFISAEIEVVPAGAARDFGFDRSMILGYGHDDRVCAYPSFMALLNTTKKLAKTACALLVDKEEIGSVGATGMQSKFFENTVAEIYNLLGDYSELKLRRALTNSKVLSSDVSAAFDPNYGSAFEKNNAAYLGRGLVFNKYTGARGKSGSNDASAEYVGEVRAIMDKDNVCWQTAELGKVDQGGGGTIAYIMGNYNMQVIDSGVAVLSMHAPCEIISKVDLYEALLGYEAFIKYA